MAQRKAFTLIEVLISIALLALMIVPLFSVIDMMRKSNDKLADALESSKQTSKATKVLFMDILSSDGQLTIQKDEYTRLCIEDTKNSLYNLPTAKVCWLVLKKDNALARIEGSAYKIPLKFEDRVEVDSVMQDIEVFDVYQQKDKVLVVLKEQGETAISFMLQGITNPVKEILPDGTKLMKDGRKILPDGTIVYKDGSKLLTDGTIVPAPVKKAPRGNGRVKPPTPNKPPNGTAVPAPGNTGP